jgi:hypothetical protein
MELAGYNVDGGLTPACESALMSPAMPDVATRRVSSYMWPRRGTVLGICLKAALGGKTA